MPTDHRTRSLRIAAIAFVALPVTLGVAGCSNSSRPDENATTSRSPVTTVAPGSPAATTVKVDIKTFQFAPKHLRVKPGTTVVWTNQDEILHTVTAGARDQTVAARFDGQLGSKGATFHVTFDETGTFTYFCSRHPGMDADIEVG